MAESEAELKNPVIKAKEKSKKAGLKLNFQNIKIMVSGPISTLSPSVCHEVMGPDALIFVF